MRRGATLSVMPQIHDYTTIDVRYPEIARSKFGIPVVGVPETRQISTTAPLTGGGDLSTDRTIGIPAASNSAGGYLTAADHAAFAAKESGLAFNTPLSRTANTISIPASTNAVDGYLTAVDHATFAAKESALTFTPPLTRTANTIAWTGTTTDVPEGVNLYWTQARFDTAFAAKSTTNLAEGTNLYFTDARAVTATLPMLMASLRGGFYLT